MNIDDAGLTLADPDAYADEDRLHTALRVLREQDPVHWVDPRPDFNPFWAVTRHSDLLEVERQNEKFINEPRPILVKAEQDRHTAENGQMLRTLVHIDDPEHKRMRSVVADWFRPRALRELDVDIRRLAKRYVDKMADLGGECDFVREVTVDYPLYVILSLLGLPESDFPRILQLTQELFGIDDEELQRGRSPEELMQVLLDFFDYFKQITADRRANPTGDLASTIANARIDGEHLSDLDTASHYVIIATAGHDTTSSTIAGGLHALVAHPEERERLRRDPELIPTAVEEMIRWVTPVKEFMRTATTDCELGGKRIGAGESLLLCYPSANRDEAVFDDPFRFDVGRDPNRHLSFGFGAHVCLGATLARMEARAFFAELLPRLDWAEAAGEPQWSSTTFVGGLKHLPLRYRIR
ncbi:cytochrome P450 [Saccharopolyspora dendranthemae]|uniref:Cytochrome P450 n=1 Tax=Saccharopolyspora dendranthemae TaxID=1181886 RepID=A0A561U8M1_9PSEU|nr:cytochrome P450 [Saccharopolyspora dendranthemae]TWF95709.1 cytochrome P450 [Saccharopolyspora dendranthemae]